MSKTTLTNDKARIRIGAFSGAAYKNIGTESMWTIWIRCHGFLRRRETVEATKDTILAEIKAALDEYSCTAARS